VEAQSPAILAADEAARALQTRLQDLLAERNDASKAIGQAKAQKDEARASELMARVATLKESIPALEAEQKAAAEALTMALATLPNLPADDVPEGADEDENVEAKRWAPDGSGPRPAEGAREHFDIGAPLGLDFESAQTVSGARFAYLRGGIARLNRALAQFMLDTHTEKFGYQEVNPPVLVRDEALFGTAQLPKFAEDLFQTTDGRWLIPTAEVSLTNLVRDQIIDAPLPCALPR
jgi:seryl-tRNA synthetase